MIFSSMIQTLKQQWQRFNRWFSLHILRRSVGTVMPIFQDETPAQLRREVEQIAVAVHDFRKLHSFSEPDAIFKQLAFCEQEAGSNPWLSQILAFQYHIGMSINGCELPDNPEKAALYLQTLNYSIVDVCQHLYDLANETISHIADHAFGLLSYLASHARQVSAMRQLARYYEEHSDEPAYLALAWNTAATVTQPAFPEDIIETKRCHLQLVQAYWLGLGTDPNQRLALYHLKQVLKDPFYYNLITEWVTAYFNQTQSLVFHSLVGLVSLDLLQNTEDKTEQTELLKLVEAQAAFMAPETSINQSIAASKDDSDQDMIDLFHLSLARYYQNSAIENASSYEISYEYETIENTDSTENKISEPTEIPNVIYLPNQALCQKAKTIYERLTIHPNAYQSYVTLELKGLNAILTSLNNEELSDFAPQATTFNTFNAITSLKNEANNSVSQETNLAALAEKTADQEIKQLNQTKESDARIRTIIHDWLQANNHEDFAGQLIMKINGNTRSYKMKDSKKESEMKENISNIYKTKLIIHLEPILDAVADVIKANETSNYNAWYRDRRRNEMELLINGIKIASHQGAHDSYIYSMVMEFVHQNYTTYILPSEYNQFIYDLRRIVKMKQTGKLQLEDKPLADQKHAEKIKPTASAANGHGDPSDDQDNWKALLFQEMKTMREENKEIKNVINDLKSQVASLTTELKSEKIKNGDPTTLEKKMFTMKPTTTNLKLSQVMGQLKKQDIQLSYFLEKKEDNYLVNVIVNKPIESNSKLLQQAAQDFLAGFKESGFALDHCSHIKIHSHTIEFRINENSIKFLYPFFKHYGVVSAEINNNNPVNDNSSRAYTYTS